MIIEFGRDGSPVKSIYCSAKDLDSISSTYMAPNNHCNFISRESDTLLTSIRLVHIKYMPTGLERWL